MIRKKILITGGSSYLGSYLVPLAHGAGWEVAYSWFTGDPLREPGGFRLDMRDRDAVSAAVARLRPDAIVHLAGSNRSADMMRVIVDGAEGIAAAAEASGARLVFMSTDVVFDGTRPPYREEDLPRPRHEYGRAKAEAEMRVARCPNHVIVRTSLIYGLERLDRGTAWVMEALNKQEAVTLFTDQLRNPVWAPALAEACLELAGHDYTGPLHVAGAQILSRAEFGLRLLDWWGCTERATLRCAPTPARAPWPADTTLAIDRARDLLRTPLPGVDEVLAQARQRG